VPLDSQSTTFVVRWTLCVVMCVCVVCLCSSFVRGIADVASHVPTRNLIKNFCLGSAKLACCVICDTLLICRGCCTVLLVKLSDDARNGVVATMSDQPVKLCATHRIKKRERGIRGRRPSHVGFFHKLPARAWRDTARSDQVVEYEVPENYQR
jgi:hypothetical protein